jgi:hypothetical protein
MYSANTLPWRSNHKERNLVNSRFITESSHSIVNITTNGRFTCTSCAENAEQALIRSRHRESKRSCSTDDEREREWSLGRFCPRNCNSPCRDSVRRLRPRDASLRARLRSTSCLCAHRHWCANQQQRLCFHSDTLHLGTVGCGRR